MPLEASLSAKIAVPANSSTQIMSVRPGSAAEGVAGEELQGRRWGSELFVGAGFRAFSSFSSLALREASLSKTAVALA